MNSTKVRSTFLVFIAIVFSLYTYRSIFSGKLLGEPFDARLMISLHEHMWRWLNGLVSFRDTEFFYPYKTALGFSDVFFVQGLAYSFFRFVGLDSLSSWVNVTIILVIIGNIGWVVVAKKYLKNFIIQFLFVLTMISSVSFVHYFTFNANVVGYAFLSWMLVFFLNISNEKKTTNFHVKVNLFVIAFLIYALSCWYAAFFLLMTIIFKLAIFIFYSGVRFNLRFTPLIIKVYLYFSPVIVFFIWLFYFVYISVSDQPERSVTEMITNSPRIQQISRGANPNGGGMEGAVFSELYKWLKLDKPIVFNEVLGDWGGGIGLFLPLLVIAVLSSNLFVTKVIKDYSWIVAVSSTYIYFMVFGNNISLHSYFFNLVPGLNSIRSPSRYIIFIGFAGIFLVFYYFDRIISRSKNYFVNIAVLLLVVTVFLDQQRISYKGWDRENFINPGLMALKSEIQNNCDYFYYDKPGGWWYDQIEALAFAVQIGVPTVNGYSGAFPPNYPDLSWNEDAPSLQIFDWMKQIEEDKKGCLILGNSNVRYLSNLVPSVDFYGFTEEESNGSSNWRWAVSKEAHLLFIGKENSRQSIEFELRGATCFENQMIEVFVSNSTKSRNLLINKKGLIQSFILDFKENRANSITFSINSPPCVLEGDPRDLYFEIKNIKLKEV